MNDALSRRQAAGLAAVATSGLLAVSAPGSDEAPNKDQAEKARVMACGFTEGEAECWVLLAQAVGKFFELPKLHPMDTQEVAQATHVIQNKLLSRPTYRKYLERAKGEKKPAGQP